MKGDIILLHGALGSKEQFSELKNRFSNKFEVHNFNFEGHGGRPSKNDFSIDLFAENIADFISENKISSPHIFG